VSPRPPHSLSLSCNSPLTSWSDSLLPEWIPVSSSDFTGEKSSSLIGGVDGGWCSGLGYGVVAGLEWFELNTKGETGWASLRIDMGEIARILGLSGLCRWSIWSNRPGNEAICKQKHKKEIVSSTFMWYCSLCCTGWLKVLSLWIKPSVCDHSTESY